MPNEHLNKTNSRRRLNVVSGDYVQIPKERTEVDGFVNEQWTTPQTALEQPPWKTIIIILTLFVGGSICIGCAILDWLHDTDNSRVDRVWALIIIGALTIIPGGYYVFLLSCILLGRRGYSMDLIRRLS